MHKLTKLFKLLELTRSQVQQGYILSRVRKHELSDLAQHSYLVTMIGWQLARLVERAGSKIKTEKILELCLVHDLGELFGGDIGKYYVTANPRARKLAKTFEIENLSFLSIFFGDDQVYFKRLAKEIMEPKSDGALVYKIADYLECAHFLTYLDNFKRPDYDIAIKTIEVAKRIKDGKAKRAILSFLRHWTRDITKKDTRASEIL